MKYACCFFTCFILTAHASYAGSSFTVEVNTSSLQGVSGFLDFQLNPEPGAQAVTASISGFTTQGGLLGTALPDIGQVSGQLPGLVTLVNDSQINDFTQSVTYGSDIQFNLSFSGAAISNPNNGSSSTGFLFSLYDSNYNPLLTSNSSGNLLEISIYPDGTTDVTTFSPGNSLTPLITVTPLSVPEPISMLPFAIGMTMLAGYSASRSTLLRTTLPQ